MKPYNGIFWGLVSADIAVFVVFYAYFLMGIRRRTVTATSYDWQDRIGYEPRMDHPNYDD